MKEFLTLKEAAELSGVSYASFVQHCTKGTVQVLRNPPVLVPRESLMKFIRERALGMHHAGRPRKAEAEK